MCEEIAGRKLDWTYSETNRIGDHRWWVSDLSAFERDHPEWSLRYSVEDILRQIHDANVEHWAAGVNLSVVIPAHNEAEVVEPTLRGLIDQLGPEEIDYEIVVVDDASSDGTGDVVAAVTAEEPRVRCVRNEAPNGFGFAVRKGLEEFRGDAVVIVMADGSDDPRDVVLYYRVLEAGYDCAFGSRFMPGARCTTTRALKLTINRIVNAGIRHALPARLQRHDERVQGLPPRGHREPPAAALAPLQPDGRAAAEGDHARLLLRDRPDLVDQPRGRHVEARSSTRWAAATCSSCSTSSSSTTSAAATTAAPARSAPERPVPLAAPAAGGRVRRRLGRRRTHR